MFNLFFDSLVHVYNFVASFTMSRLRPPLPLAVHLTGPSPVHESLLFTYGCLQAHGCGVSRIVENLPVTAALKKVSSFPQ